ncbi:MULTISPECIES: SRPBCC family protein [unclassified Aureispira]|uniref:SRPBCC family protein n=1 Tax=unclassified Aureispira TaxID=2649989 RepID=UPI000697A971|nr:MULTISPECIES: SRPBCC family protein [unclassified Aureispira]WMX15552.1 SRPBCC family protein [Aureispira sp. CCB-E]
MPTLFILFTLLGFFFLTIVLAGLFLPSTWIIEKAELIHATPSDLFSLVNSLEEWSNWTVWSSEDKDSNLTFEYPDQKEGLGAVQIWRNNRINGVLTITESVANKEIKYQFDIQEGNLTLLGTIVLAPADTNYTQIAWRCQLKELTDNNPIRRYQAYFLKNYFDTTIEANLASMASMFNTTDDASDV